MHSALITVAAICLIAGTAGASGMTVPIPCPRPKQVRISLTDPVKPQGDATPGTWPVLATDIITQVRFRLRDGTYTDWQPRNLLRGGDMADSNNDGIPDWVSVMHIHESGNLMYVDTSASDWMPPDGDYWQDKVRKGGRSVDRVDFPPGAKQSLRLTRATSDGQDTSAMRLDLVPPDTDLTVCGWTKYDLGDETSMGVMARFHEFDATGERVNKYVLLGDDNFHQPSGRSKWVWRALSFRSLPDTTFLNLYPIRMIAAQGRAWAANYEIRLGSVFSDWGKGHAIFRETFESTDGWDVSGEGTYGLDSKGKHSLRLSPKPFEIMTAVQRKPFTVKAGQMYAFRIAMQNDVPISYDKTHQGWMSAYLEFYDKEMRFLDYCKVMAFRPTLDRPTGAAMRAPDGTRYARFLLAASHISYGDREGMTGSMNAFYDALQVEESDFDPTFTPRTDEITAAVPKDADRAEMRSFVLSRQKGLTPAFSGYRIGWE